MMARIKLGAALACALLLSACAVQNKAAMDEVGMPQVPPTVTMAEADAKLKQVSSERAAAESAYAARELVCYDRFFVNNCLDKAKETRRITLMRLRAIEADPATRPVLHVFGASCVPGRRAEKRFHEVLPTGRTPTMFHQR